MIIKTYSTKRYFLSDKDVNTLHKAAELLDNLYEASVDGGDFENMAIDAKDRIKDLLAALHYTTGKEAFWEELCEIEEES